MENKYVSKAVRFADKYNRYILMPIGGLLFTFILYMLIINPSLFYYQTLECKTYPCEPATGGGVLFYGVALSGTFTIPVVSQEEFERRSAQDGKRELLIYTAYLLIAGLGAYKWWRKNDG